jgi:hypothetical protein
MSKTITQFCLQESQIRSVILKLEILAKKVYASAWKQRSKASTNEKKWAKNRT